MPRYRAVCFGARDHTIRRVVDDDGAAPLGSWTRLYLVVATAAIGVMLLLYALTATFNVGSAG